MSGTVDGRGTIISHNTLYDIGTQTHSQLENSISVINSAISGINGEITTLQGDVAAIVVPGEATSLIPGTVYGSTQGGGNSNMTIGYNSAPNIGGGAQFTTAMGFNSMSTTGALACWHDSAFGADAMTSYVTGTYNSAFGSDAGSVLTNGNNNTFIGGAANTDAATSNDRVAIGYGAVAKADAELAITPAVTQWRSEGLADSAGFMIPLAMSTGGIIKKMPHGLVWGAQVATDYSQAISSGGSNAIITGLVVEFGDPSRLLSNAFSVPPGLGYATDGLWEVTAQIRVTGNAALTALNLEILKNMSTSVCAWEHSLNSAQWITHGGTRIIKLSPGDAIQMRMGWTSSSATSVTIKATTTYLQVRYLGASGM